MKRYRKKGRDRAELQDRLNALNKRRGTGGRKLRGRGSLGGAIVSVVLVLLVLAGGYLLLGSRGGEPAGRAKITVEEGETLSQVAQKLENAGVVGNSGLFELRARIQGKGSDVKPGTYQIQRGESANRILAMLSEGQPVPTFKVTVPEGLTVEQTARIVAQNSGVSAAEFEKAAQSTDYDYAFLQDKGVKTTEGFLFPKTYEFERGSDAPRVVARMLEQYYIETQSVDLEGAGRKLNLTEEELVTVASLIEREAANEEEKPVIASVIYNRMRADMPLQVDATVQYALGRPKAELSLGDLKIDSPYNTYENPGLPPTPIASPGLSSIQAAANPADTEYLYYVLKKGGGEHEFSKSFKQHQQAMQKAGR